MANETLLQTNPVKAAPSATAKHQHSHAGHGAAPPEGQGHAPTHPREPAASPVPPPAGQADRPVNQEKAAENPPAGPGEPVAPPTNPPATHGNLHGDPGSAFQHAGEGGMHAGHETHGMKTHTTPTGEVVMIHQMDGIPAWMASGGLIAIILLTHLFLFLKKGKKEDRGPWRFDLFRFPRIKALVKKPFFPILAQSGSILLFLLVIGAGLFGSQRTNIAPVLTWTWWWILLIFFIVGFGKVFCTICPWEGIASVVTSLSLKSRVKKLGFEFTWPGWMKNIYPAMGMFIILTWLELGFDITRSPSSTALMALAFIGMVVLTALVFERRAFCRYVCLVGRIQGLYALFSPMELRPQSADTCRTCESKACYTGTETAVGCPTHLFPGSLHENTYCTLCTECVRSCPHDNIGIQFRPPATDLYEKTWFRLDEAILAVVLLALTSFHGLTMTPLWGRLNDLLRVDLGWGAKPVFSVLMIIMILLPLLLFWGAACGASWITRAPDTGAGRIFRAFSYALIPIALFYHLAHNGMHWFMEAQNIVPLLSDPFGRGWDLFGTAGKAYGPLLSLEAIWWIQILLIVVGHVYGVLVADRIAHVVFGKQRRKVVMKGLFPLMVMMIFYSAFSVWLITQPMDMRTGM